MKQMIRAWHYRGSRSACAIVRNNLALHRPIEIGHYASWAITHVPTGYRVAFFLTGQCARRAFRHLATLGDWQVTTSAEARALPYAEQVQRYLREIDRVDTEIFEGRH